MDPHLIMDQTPLDDFLPWLAGKSHEDKDAMNRNKSFEYNTYVDAKFNNLFPSGNIPLGTTLFGIFKYGGEEYKQLYKKINDHLKLKDRKVDLITRETTKPLRIRVDMRPDEYDFSEPFADFLALLADTSHKDAMNKNESFDYKTSVDDKFNILFPLGNTLFNIFKYDGENYKNLYKEINDYLKLEHRKVDLITREAYSPLIIRVDMRPDGYDFSGGKKKRRSRKMTKSRKKKRHIKKKRHTKKK